MDQKIETPISKLVYEDIYHTFTQYDREMCGILGSTDGVTITNWKFIYSDNSSKFNIKINKHILDCVVNNIWKSQAIQFVGLVHSHICGEAYLSSIDVHAASKILKMNPQLPYLYMLIFQRVQKDHLYGYRLSFDDLCEKVEICFAESIWKII